MPINTREMIRTSSDRFVSSASASASSASNERLVLDPSTETIRLFGIFGTTRFCSFMTKRACLNAKRMKALHFLYYYISSDKPRLHWHF